MDRAFKPKVLPRAIAPNAHDTKGQHFNFNPFELMNRYPLRFALVLCGLLISFAFTGLATAQSKHRYFLSANNLQETQTEVPIADNSSTEQETAHLRKVELGTDYFKDFLHDIYYILTSPARWNTTDCGSRPRWYWPPLAL